MKFFKKNKKSDIIIAFGLIPDNDNDEIPYWEDSEEYKQIINQYKEKSRA